MVGMQLHAVDQDHEALMASVDQGSSSAEKGKKPSVKPEDREWVNPGRLIEEYRTLFADWASMD